MSEQSGNRIPKYPTPAPYEDLSADAENAVPKTTYGDKDLISPKGEAGGGQEGVRPWVSHPVADDQYNIEAGERFKQQGSLPTRQNISPEDGTIEAFSHRND